MKHLNVRDLEQINLEKENIPVLGLPSIGDKPKKASPNSIKRKSKNWRKIYLMSSMEFTILNDNENDDDDVNCITPSGNYS